MLASAVRLSAVLALSTAAAVCQDDEKPFHPEWLATDLAMARSVRAVLEEPPLELDEWIERLGAKVDGLDRDCGFGGRQVELVRYGGYTSCWITITAFEGEVADLTFFQDCSREREERQWRALETAWGKVAAAAEDGFHFSLRRDEILGRYRQAVERKLARAPEIEPTEELTAALSVLTSPREVYDWGTVCYYAGVAPAGREATEKLIAAGHPEAFRVALRGLNPEGRLYAAEALLRLEKKGTPLSPADRDTIEKLRRLPVPIETCSGCTVVTRTAAEVLAEVERELDRR